jgi:hypothetical protein
MMNVVWIARPNRAATRVASSAFDYVLIAHALAGAGWRSDR